MFEIKGMPEMTMDEIVMKYPDMWVALENHRRDTEGNEYGTIRAVFKDSERMDAEEEMQDKGYADLYWKRTTETIEENVLCF